MKKALLALLALALILSGCDFFSPPEEYQIFYDGNGNTAGTAPAASAKTKDGNQLTVAAGGNLAKIEHTFAGWNTKANGSGTAYLAGNQVTISGANVILYAQWTDLIVGTWEATLNLGIFGFSTLDQYDSTVIGVDGTFSTTREVRVATTTTTVPYDAQFAVLGLTTTNPQLINSGTYTRVLGHANFGLPQVDGNDLSYTGYFTRTMTFSTHEYVGDILVSTDNPKQQNWITHFSVDANTLTMYDGGTIMPVTRIVAAE
jgi:hypothetical protein